MTMVKSVIFFVVFVVATVMMVVVIVVMAEHVFVAFDMFLKHFIKIVSTLTIGIMMLAALEEC